YIAAYRAWLGEAPVTSASAATSRGVRRHKASEDDLDLSRPVELVVLAITPRAARCRLLGSDRVITLRAGSLHRVVAGQIASVQPSKYWTHGGHPYLSGQIVSTRIDTAALGLVPLALREAHGGPPAAFEMELPGRDPEDAIDPTLARTLGPGEHAEADELAERLLETDLRDLAAHTYLGNRLLGLSPQWALHHYEVGVRIAELSVRDGFDGVLPWSLVGNRPLLSCLLGYGECLWQLERWDEAERQLARLVRLDPADPRDVGSRRTAVQARRAWIDGQSWR
nr:cytoplasmic protein [Deltaproteobacteria bacterium]